MGVLDPRAVMLQFQQELEGRTRQEGIWPDRVHAAALDVYAHAKRGVVSPQFREAKPYVVVREKEDLPLGVTFSNRPHDPGNHFMLPLGTRWFSHTYSLVGKDGLVIAFDDVLDLHPYMDAEAISVPLARAREDLIARLGGGFVVAPDRQGFYERRFYEEVNGHGPLLNSLNVPYTHHTRIKKIPPRK